VKDILIIAHFTQVPGEAGNGRFHYIAEKLEKHSANVELVTTNFSHRTKKFRNVTNKQHNNLSYRLTMLRETGYKKNVSLIRFYSHYRFSISLKKYLEKRKIPDVIYCTVPSLDVGYVAAKYSQKNNVRFIIDIQDLWPEAFKMVFNLPFISDFIFNPMKQKANYIYSKADNIIAVSRTYVDRGLSVNSKLKEGTSVFLGTDLQYFDILKKRNLVAKPNDEIWVAYIGTLGKSYNLYSVVDALKTLKDEGYNNIKFVIMGDGPLKFNFEYYANKGGINAEFTGRLSYDKMVGILSSCDIAVNPIKAGSAGSIINKVGDYAAAGLPVINTQESDEYKDLVECYGIGFNCINNSSTDLANKLKELIEDEKLRGNMGKNNRKLAEDLFNRKKTYKQITKILEESL